jgi:hypothetical protein
MYESFAVSYEVPDDLYTRAVKNATHCPLRVLLSDSATRSGAYARHEDHFLRLPSLGL